MRFSHLESADCTDTGRKRKHNEDSLLRVPEQGLFCVADGMGGTFGGEVASQAAVEGLQHEFQNIETDGRARSFEERIESVRKALNESSSWIRNHADEMGVTGTGTTAIVLLFDPARPERAAALHAGDSRAYRYRDGKLQQVTMDHSVAAAAGVKSDKALPAMFRGVVTRAVGLEKQVALEETPVDVAPGDLFMLCSDGLSKMVPDKNIARMIKDQGVGDLAALAKLLVDAANAAGGEDNTSVVLVRVGANLPAPAPTEEAAPPRSSDASATAHDGLTQATRPASQELTQATRPAPPPSAAPNGNGKPPDRKSDPQHFSGVTPAGVESATPDTSDFQRTPTAHSTIVDRESERTTALKHIEAGRRQNLLLMICIGLVVVILAVTSILLLRGRKTAEQESPAPSTSVPVTPAEEGTPVPVGESVAPVEAAPVAVVESVPAAAAEPAPVAAPAPSGPSAEEIEKARNSLQVDMLETLMTGRWGDLEPRVESVRELVPGAVEGMPEAPMYAAWLELWQQAEMGSLPASDVFSELRDAALAVVDAGAMNANIPASPAWAGSPRQRANTFCSVYHALQTTLLDALDDHALAAQHEAELLRQQTVPVVEWIQAAAAEPDTKPREAVESLRVAAQAEAEWVLARSSARAPVPTQAIRETAAAHVEAVEAARDAFYTALVDTVRAWNTQKSGWEESTDAALKEKVYQIGVQRVRIVNIRARYKDDVRDWRRHEGVEDLKKFLGLVREAFPESAPGP